MLVIRKHLALFLVITVSLFLRWWNYAYFPVGGETADEYAWTMLGASLIQEGAPASWSYFSAYENYRYVEGIFDAPIVRPALDHPPLFSLLPGAAHSIKSFWLDSPSLKVIRAPLVILGAVNVGIFWLVCRQIFTKKSWAIVGSILFMTIPSLVFGSRLVVAENLLVTWILLALLLIFNKSNRWTVPGLMVICMAAILTKIAGLIIPVSLLAYGLLTGQPKLSKAAGVGGLLGVGLFAWYGAFYNWSLFWAIFLDQADRQLGLATLQNRLFLNPTIVRHLFFDGWQILGLFASFWLLARPKKNEKLLFVHLLTIVSLLFVVLSAGESTFHGWYDYVLWPTLIISLTVLVKHIWQTGNNLLLGLAWLFLLPGLRLSLLFIDNYAKLSNWSIRGLVLVGFLPLVGQLIGRPAWAKKMLWLIFLILIISNVTTVLALSHEVYWEQAAFFELPP
jgi:hypothetical protein